MRDPRNTSTKDQGIIAIPLLSSVLEPSLQCPVELHAVSPYVLYLF